MTEDLSSIREVKQIRFWTPWKKLLKSEENPVLRFITHTSRYVVRKTGIRLTMWYVSWKQQKKKELMYLLTSIHMWQEVPCLA